MEESQRGRDNPRKLAIMAASMSDPSHDHRWLLHRADQAAVVALVVAALASMFVWWIAQGGWGGRLLEIDRAEPLTARFQVDINTADLPELMQLPGIGETLAQQIIDSRKAAGPFVDQDDLRRVSGIGAKRMDRIRPYLRPIPGRANIAGH